jgi:GTP-binding protein EngB required for normal cell division
VNRGILELIDAVELAVSRSTGSAPRQVIAEAQRRIDGLRDRRGHFGEVLVVALAGGTGCGKSSVLNAIAGEDVAGVSVLRPHTQTPLAWIPRGHSEGIERLLDDLEISQRMLQDVLPSIAFLDLPDVDSIADWHRQMVEHLLPHVDAVLWVVDPEKYHDEVIHEQFLSPVASFGDQFLFVLNKIDRLSAEETDTIREDLAASLSHDGFKRPLVFPVAADPEFGPTRGIEELVEFLADQVDVKRVAISKAVNDMAAILEELGTAAQVWDGGFVDYRSRWQRARDLSAEELVANHGAGVRHDVICRLEDLIAALAVEVGPTLGQTLREEFPSHRVEQAVDAATAGLTQEAAALLAARLDAALGDPLTLLLWQRAHFAATLAGAVVATHQLKARHAAG